MKRDLSRKNPTEIFSGALWAQRPVWRRAMPLLPANSYLLVIDSRNKKQTQVIRQLAQTLRDKGRPVLIWMSPTKIEGAGHQ